MIIRNGFYSTLPILLMLFVAIQVFGEQKSEGDEASSVSKKSQPFVKPVILEISNRVNLPGKDASPQSCYVDLSIPDTATVRLDGDYYGDERLFEFSPIKSNEAVTAILEVVFANGTRESRKIDLIAGKHIKLRIEEPVASSPEDNERKNTQTGERDIAVPPSNSRSVTEEIQENGFPESTIPQDKCIVDITVPKETKIEVDGIDYETQRGFEFTSLSPGEVYQNQFVFHFPNGQKQKKKLLIQGGKRVRLALQEPSPVQPELVLQTGHSEEITSIAFSPDGKHFMTGSVGGKAILWDSETGVQLRTYQSGALHKNDIAQLMSKFERSIFPGTTSSYSLASKSALPKILSIDFSLTDKRRFMMSCAPYGFFGGGFTTAVSGFVFDVESGEQLHSFPLRESLSDLEYISPVSLNPDGKNLIVGGRGNREITLQNAYLQGLGDPRLLTEQSLSILDIKSNKIIGGAGGTNRAITLLKFSPDKKKIVTIGKNYLQNPAIYERVFSRLTQVIAETIQYLKQSNLTQREVEEFYAGKSPNGEKMRTVNLYLNKQAEILDALDQESIIPEDDIENILQIWDPNPLSEIRNFKIPKSPVYLSVSNEGQYVLLGYRSNRDFGPVDWELWDTIAQKILLKFQAGSDPVLTPDGRYVVSYGNRNLNSNSSDHRIHFWNTETLTDVGSIKNEKTNIASQICPLPDSRHVAVLYSYQIEIYEIPTGRLIRTYRFHATDPLDSHQLSPKGKYIVIGDGLWDTQTGMKSFNLINGSIEKSGEFLADTIDTFHVVSNISPDGQSIVYSEDKKKSDEDFRNPKGILRLTSIQTGRLLQKYQLPSGMCNFLCFSSDGKRILAVSNTGHITVWNTLSGEIETEIQTNTSNNPGAYFLTPGPKTFSPDGRRVYLHNKLTQTVWWDRKNGERLNRSRVNELNLLKKTRENTDEKGSLSSKDGQILLSISENGNSVLVKEIQSERVLYDLKVEHLEQGKLQRISLYSPGFDESGQYIFAEYSKPVFEGWDTVTGNKLLDFPSGFLEIIHSAKSVISEKELIAAALPNGDVNLLNITTGERISTLKHQSEVHSIAFHSNGNQLLAGCADRTAILWDLTDNSILQTFKGHEGPIDSVSLKTDGTLALTTSAVDSTTRIWDVSTGKELCALISINNRTDWLVVTPEGLFDGSAGGRKEVVFRIGGGLNVVPVDRFFQDFYYPGLLSAIWRGERPLPEVRLGESLPPKLKIVSPGEGGIIETPQVTLEIEAVDQGGGISGLELFINNQKILTAGESRQDKNSIFRTFEDVLLIEGENHIEVRAASADGSWQSEPARILFRYEKPLSKPKLYLVTVGINQYADPSLNLKFAVNDANAINKLFEIEGPKLYEQVNSTILLDKSATRSRIVSEIRKVANLAKAQDTVIVFLAGHSAVLGKQYFFLPHEFKIHSSLREENIREAGLLADSLGEELSRIPALKRILIFDTGRSKLKFNSTSRNPFALRSAVEKLVHANGGFTLAAATTTDNSHEVSVLKQGVLTYSLLSGLHATNAGPLTNEWIKTSDKNNVADVLEWFSYANLHVPQLTRQYFGTEQNIHFSSAGYSFPVLPVLVSKNSHTKQQPSLQDSIEKPKKQKHRRITISPHSSNKNKLGNLHLVCIGINRYSDKTLNLQFARPDAEAIAQLFRTRGQHTFNKVIVDQLLDEQATRESILDTLKGLAKRVNPEDTFMFFVSSHGAMSGQRYFVIPHEFQTSVGRTLSEDLNNQGVAGDELGDLIREIPAKQRVLIFDTCRSGGSLTFAKSRPDTFQIQGFLGKLESKAGSFTIAACSANQDAQENAELGHGVLTYALLAGLRGVKSGPLVDRAIAPNRIDGTVDILEWINYASGQVPRLMKQYYGREQFIKHNLRGASFPVLQLAN